MPATISRPAPSILIIEVASEQQKVNEHSAKFMANMLLNDKRNGIRIPTVEEWIGVNLLERDDEMRRDY